MVARMWTTEHVDFIEQQVRADNDITAQEIATRMAKHYRHRVTPSQVNILLQRMRSPQHPFFRNLPYRRAGARFQG